MRRFAPLLLVLTALARADAAPRDWRKAVDAFADWLVENDHQCGAGLAKRLRASPRKGHPEDLPKPPSFLVPVVRRASEISAAVPGSPLTRSYPAGACRSMALTFKDLAADSKTPTAFVETALRRVRLGAKEEGALPLGLAEADFRKDVTVWSAFLMKHRHRRAPKVLPATPEDILAGKVSAQVYVEVVGTVTKAPAKDSADGDRTFNFGELHCEVPPEVAAAKPGLYRPKRGDVVKARGWTFLDINHEQDEEEGARDSLWELHPVFDVELVTAAPAKP